MTGRELKRHNDLFYLCALIEYVARATKNRNRVIVNALGEERLTKIYKLADIYHSDNIARVAYDLIKECNIENDYFDITDVIHSLCDKLIHRHPHIYATTKANTAGDVERNWEQIKLKEKKGLPFLLKK